MTQRFISLLIGFLLSFVVLNAQQSLFIEDAKSEHSFGIIAEEGGNVIHSFVIKNPTDSPMVIHRVVADCGCTTPQWSDAPIAKGDSTPIRVAFNPEGRPGTFVKYIRVYNNLTKDPIQLVIKGNVSTRGMTSESDRLFEQKIGPLMVSNTRLVFPLHAQGQDRVIRFVVNNPTKETLHVVVDSLPEYLSLSKNEMILAPDEPDQIFVSTQKTQEMNPNYYQGAIYLTVRPEKGVSHSGKVAIELPLAPHFSDDLLLLPEASLKTYHSLKDIDLSKPVLNYDIEIQNKAEEEGTLLHFYSTTSDREWLSVRSIDQDIPSGKSGYLRLSIDLKQLKATQQASSGNVTLMTNDPKAPMRKIKIVLSL